MTDPVLEPNNGNYEVGAFKFSVAQALRDLPEYMEGFDPDITIQVWEIVPVAPRYNSAMIVWLSDAPDSLGFRGKYQFVKLHKEVVTKKPEVKKNKWEKRKRK